MSSSIVSPFPVFNDLDGTPLEAGYIYIGTANLNPEVTPINLFWDEAMTIPAANPVRTVGGFFSRNGSPGNIYIAADNYSITVRNRNQAFVFGAQDSGNPIFLGYPILKSQLAPTIFPIDGTDCNFVQAGTGAVTRTMQAKARETVSPLDFGAVGDGTTNDTAAVKLALQSGKVVDGGGLTYGISGELKPTSIIGLKNTNLNQISPSASIGINTLNIEGISNFFIDNVRINMGNLIQTAFGSDINQALFVHGTNTSTPINNFKITRVEVTGDGCGTGISVRYAERFNVDNCFIHDRVSGSYPDPTNDSQNGIQIFDCADFVISNCIIYNLKTRINGIAENRYTRGIALIEGRDFNIVGCNVTLVDQCYDISGGTKGFPTYKGNRNFTITGCTANVAGFVGFKFANVTKDGIVSGCIASNCGNFGFLASAPQENSDTLPENVTQRIDFVGCKVVNTKGVGISGTNSTGFRIMSTSPTYATYPRAIRFIGCSVTDNQDTPTTTIGFGTDADRVYPTTAGFNSNIANIVSNCHVSSNVTTPFSGIGPNFCSVTGSATQPVPSGVWTDLVWGVNIYDFTGLHSESTNTSSIYIKSPGFYSITARMQFPANPTGIRQIRITVNGSSVDRTISIMAASSSIVTVQTNTIRRLISGDYVRVECTQDSGSTMNVQTNEGGLFTVTRIDA